MSTTQTRLTDSPTITVTAVGPHKPSDGGQNITMLYYVRPIVGANLDKRSSIPTSNSPTMAAYPLRKSKGYLHGRATWDPSQGVSAHSLESGNKFSSIIHSHFDSEKIVGFPSPIVHGEYASGTSIASMLMNVHERCFTSRVSQIQDSIKQLHARLPDGEGDFEIAFADTREEYLKARPSITEGVPEALSTAMHERILKTDWKDCIVGDWSRIPHSTDGTVMVPVALTFARSWLPT
ncbi:uncharacterized protein L199_000850 [Kwoniella botswanensis]|uniref:uncharacterized protein n=1 Tax=Kwoniella botswanensis TaxID=1268659 RepID=UPI00315DF327